MYRKLLLGLVVAALMTSGAIAQSSHKRGSQNRNNANTASAEMRKEKRMAAKEQAKLVGQIQREDFAGIKLEKEQRDKLKMLVNANYDRLAKINMQIGQMIPATSQKNLQKNYLMAKKEGMTHAESMKKSMMTIGIPETTNKKVMMLNESRETVLNEIRGGVMEMLTSEQKEAKMMADKQGEKEQVGEST